MTTTEGSGTDTGADPRGMLDELRAQALKIAAELPEQLQRVALRAGGVSVEVEWRAPAAAPAPAPPAPAPAAAPAAAPVAAAAPAAAPAAASAADENRITVTAPLVGTFYRAPQPGAAPFVEPGDVVEPGRTLAVIEAMKLLNEVTADTRARVVAVHADNGEMVEYGQRLLELEPVD